MANQVINCGACDLRFESYEGFIYHASVNHHAFVSSRPVKCPVQNCFDTFMLINGQFCETHFLMVHRENKNFSYEHWMERISQRYVVKPQAEAVQDQPEQRKEAPSAEEEKWSCDNCPCNVNPLSSLECQVCDTPRCKIAKKVEACKSDEDCFVDTEYQREERPTEEEMEGELDESDKDDDIIQELVDKPYVAKTRTMRLKLPPIQLNEEEMEKAAEMQLFLQKHPLAFKGAELMPFMKLSYGATQTYLRDSFPYDVVDRVIHTAPVTTARD